MGPRTRKNSVVEREGVNFVRAVVEGANCLFHEIDLRNDYGNDAIIELVDGDVVRGICIAAQIKSGKSYISGKSCIIPADKAQFEYWSSHSLPVVGIVYDVDDSCAYWFSLGNYLKANKHLIAQGPYTIKFDKQEVNRFDTIGLRDFFLPLFLKRPIVLDYDRSIRFARSPTLTEHQVGLRSLLQSHRHREEVWDFFLDILRTREASDIDGYLIYILSLIPGHGDIFWHSGNIIPKDLQPILRTKLSRLDYDDVVRILSFVGEGGYQRGSLGQCVDAIVSTAENRDTILLKIVSDGVQPEELRKDALTLLTFYNQKDVLPLLGEVISEKSELGEFALYLKSQLETHGYLYAY